jgi:hypothetical protein
MNAIRSALHQGFPVGGAWRIYSGFQRETAFHKTNVFPEYLHDPDAGTYVGNHAMTIVGYDVIDGDEYFLIQNSWGKGFGYDGLFWAHRDWIDTAWDLTVVRVVPLAKPGDDRQQDHHADDHVRVGTHEQKRLPNHAPSELQHPIIVPEETREEHPARYHASARLLHPPAPQQAHPAAARPGVRRRLRAAHRAEGGVPLPRRHHHRGVLQALQRGRAPAPRHHQGVLHRGGADVRGREGVRGEPLMSKHIVEVLGSKVVDGNKASLQDALKDAYYLGMKSALCMVLAKVFGQESYEYGVDRPENLAIENTVLMGRIIGLYTDALNEENSVFVGKLNRRIQMAESARKMHEKMIVELEQKLAETKREHLSVSQMEQELIVLHQDICGEGK